ncbi:MAG: hypothetical protein V3R81_01580, partial [Gammaproteobacteria bacterium]
MQQFLIILTEILDTANHRRNSRVAQWTKTFKRHVVADIAQQILLLHGTHSVLNFCEDLKQPVVSFPTG